MTDHIQIGEQKIPCQCPASDARVCWALGRPDAYFDLDWNPPCSCTCHKKQS